MVNINTFQPKSISLLLGALVVATLAFSAPQAHAASFRVFTDKAVESDNISSFAKWIRVTKESHPDETDDWKKILSNTSKDHNLQALKSINQKVNSYRYIEDKKGWKDDDYWATPQQFFSLGGGDCEDYAIVKYMALRALGWPPESMRIVILQDTKLKELHAVLAVNLDGDTYILDNQMKNPVKDRKIAHYTPIYSINESAWWRYDTSHT